MPEFKKEKKAPRETGQERGKRRVKGKCNIARTAAMILLLAAPLPE